jgi:hypothetical protein
MLYCTYGLAMTQLLFLMLLLIIHTHFRHLKSRPRPFNAPKCLIENEEFLLVLMKGMFVMIRTLSVLLCSVIWCCVSLYGTEVCHCLRH